jgi:hypothetical protein
MRRLLVAAVCLLGLGASKPLEVSITKFHQLPPAMVGEWSVSGRLIQSDLPGFFAPVVHDVWILSQDGRTVTLSNPASGASTQIAVEAVEEDTATFQHQVPLDRGRVISERPTLTLRGDTMTGTSRNRLTLLKQGKQYEAVYELRAVRMGGSAFRLQHDPAPEEFEITPVQTGD